MRCDAGTTTQTGARAGRSVILLGLAVTRPTPFITLRVVQQGVPQAQAD